MTLETAENSDEKAQSHPIQFDNRDGRFTSYVRNPAFQDRSKTNRCYSETTKIFLLTFRLKATIYSSVVFLFFFFFDVDHFLSI